MKKITTGLVLVGLAYACGSARGEPSYGPPGSSLVSGRVCFEGETDGGQWERVGLVTADGTHAVRFQVARGGWYFPAGYTRVRVVPNCKEKVE